MISFGVESQLFLLLERRSKCQVGIQVWLLVSGSQFAITIEYLAL